MLIGSFLIELTFFKRSWDFFLNFKLSLEMKIAKRKFSDNPSHIFELGDILVQV